MTGVVSPDQKTRMVLPSGYNSFCLQSRPDSADLDPVSAECISVHELSGGKPVRKQVLTDPASHAGIAFSPDGSKLPLAEPVQDR